MARLRLDRPRSPTTSPTTTRPPGPGSLRVRGPLVPVAVAAVGWVYLAPNYWIFTVTSALIGAVAALGLWVLVSWAGEINLAQAGLIGSGVFICGYLYRTEVGGHGWPFLAAAALTVVCTSLLAAAAALPCVRLSGVYVLVLTLGLQFVIERVIFTKGELTGGVVPMQIPRPALFGVNLTTDRGYYFFALAVLTVLLVGVARLRRSRYGHSLRLIGFDRRAACALGVSPWRYKVFAFVICGALAGFSGALAAPFFEAAPRYESYLAPTSLGLLAVPILAGIESSLAVVAVSLLLGIVPVALESLRISVPLLGGFGLIAGVFLGPRGLGGAVMGSYRKRRRAGWRRQAPTVTQGVASTGTGTDPGDPGGGSPLLGARHRDALGIFADWLPSPTGGDDALTAAGVSVTYGGVVALDDVSITVPAGALVGLIGPNGAGKSTLFDVVNGLTTPDRGTVALFGRDITRLRPWKRTELGMSRTFQANRVNLELTVRDNLISGAHTMIGGSLAGVLAGLPRASASMREAEEAARAVATLFDIEHHWHEVAGALSYGNRRRVEIGRSLMSGPRLLLLDEPAAGLDPATSSALFTLLKELHRDLGVSVLLVEHHVRAVLANCDLIHVLNGGRLVTSGTPDEVASHPDVASQYLGAAFQAHLATATTNNGGPSEWAAPDSET